MITKKTWVNFTYAKTGGESFASASNKTAFRDTYTGWFLFGVIPLYKTRDRQFRYARDAR
jgi:hypothetical protein